MVAIIGVTHIEIHWINDNQVIYTISPLTANEKHTV